MQQAAALSEASLARDDQARARQVAEARAEALEGRVDGLRESDEMCQQEATQLATWMEELEQQRNTLQEQRDSLAARLDAAAAAAAAAASEEGGDNEAAEPPSSCDDADDLREKCAAARALAS